MAATIVQTAKGTSTLATVTASFATTPTNGNVIILAFASDDYNGTPNAGWNQRTGMEQQTYHGGYVWDKVASGGSNSFQYTIGSATNSSWVLLEISGLDASYYDVSVGNFAQSFGNTLASTNLTPTSGQRLILAFFGASSDGSSSDFTGNLSASNSFTHVVSSGPNGVNNSDFIGCAQLVVTANGSTAYNTTGTIPAYSQSRSAMLISLKVATGGGTSDIEGNSTLTFTQIASLKAKGKLAGTATATFNQTASLKGKGKLAGPSTITFSQTSNLKGKKNIIGSSSVVFSSTSSLKGVGKLTGSSALTFTASLNNTGFSLIEGSTTLSFPEVLWSQTSSSALVWTGLASSSDGSKLLAGSNANHLYTSADGGITWTQRNVGTTKNWSHVTSSASGQYLAATNNDVLSGYVWISSDYGVSWTAKTGAGASGGWQGLFQSADGQLLIAVPSTGDIQISTDFGNTWTAKTVASTLSGIAGSDDGQILYITTSNNGIYKSVDYGVTWNSLTGIGSSPYAFPTCSGDGVKVAVVYANNTYVSLDSGATWTQKSTDPSGAVPNYSRDGSILSRAVYSGYVYTSIDDGDNWVQETSAGQRNWQEITSSYNGKKIIVAGLGISIYIRIDNKANLIGKGKLAGSSSLTFVVDGDLVGLVFRSGSTTLTFNQNGSLKGKGKLTGPSSLTFTQTSSLKAKGKLSGPTTLTFTTSSDLRARSYGVGSSTLTFTTSAVIKATHNIDGSTTLTFIPTADLEAKGKLTGSSNLTFTGNAVIVKVELINGSSSIQFNTSAKGLLYKIPYENTNSNSNFIYYETADVAPIIYGETSGNNPNIIYEED